MIERVSENVWKLKADGNIYVLQKEAVVIDTGNRANRSLVEQFLSKIIPFEDVKKVIFTHLHYDHIGNFDLFENAEFFASQEEIDCFEKSPDKTVLDKLIAKKFKGIKLSPAQGRINGLEVIKTPGHTRGSICLWEPVEKMLFSGDTLLMKGHGRTDLPTSAPAEMQSTILKLLNYNYRILCPGHEY